VHSFETRSEAMMGKMLHRIVFFHLALIAALVYCEPAFAAVSYVPDDHATIQDAIDAAVNGDVIIVRDGTYTGNGNRNINFYGKHIMLRSENGPGDCIIDGTPPEERNYYLISTAFTFNNQESSSSVLSGFTIQNFPTGSTISCNWSSPVITNCVFVDNGNGLGSSTPGGSAIYCAYSSPSIIGCSFQGNSRPSYGGGGAIYCAGSSPSITDCSFTANTASNGDGGAIYCDLSSSPTISNCAFSANAANYGGAVSASADSYPTITSCTFSGNTAAKCGGGVAATYESSVVNCTFYNNAANEGGGGVYSYYSTYFRLTFSPTITNCTIVDNVAGSAGGGGIYCVSASAVITNCIVWNNSPDEIVAIDLYGVGAYPVVSYSDVEGGYSGTGNINSDPLFVDATGGDYHLSEGSPCIDAGTSSGAPADDIDGDIRPQAGGYDIGSDEQCTSCRSLWQDWFAVDAKETPMVGDFNGDGLTDIITFTRDNPNAVGDVYVALSDGTQFGSSEKWHDWFAVSADQTVVIGDYNGDGLDDIATWLRTTSREVYVALSYGSGMDTESIWLSTIGVDNGDLLQSGDFNGDGYDDLVLFARNEGKVYVALSNGNGFAAPTVWHNWFAVSSYERPKVGDIDGDGLDDIVTFATDSPTAQGDVYIALSTGARFGDGQNSDKWHDWFSVDPEQTVQIGDLDGDGRDDFLTFMPPPSGQVYAVYSEGSFLSDNVLWNQDFASSESDIPCTGDVNGDGKSDLIGFYQGEGKVYVVLSP
jgi:predicted outer membrane repeat protein